MIILVGISVCVTIALCALSFLLYRHIYINVKQARMLIGADMGGVWFLFIGKNNITLNDRDQSVVNLYVWLFPLSIVCTLLSFATFLAYMMKHL